MAEETETVCQSCCQGGECRAFPVCRRCCNCDRQIPPEQEEHARPVQQQEQEEPI